MSTDLSIQEDQSYWTERQVAALRQIGVANAASADLAVFFHYAVKTGLDPFARQIYMIERYSNGRTIQTIQTGIDGFRLIARRAADHAAETFSISDTLWCGDDGHWRDVWLKDGHPSASKVTVFRAGQPFSAVALFSEYAGTKKGGGLSSMWATKGAMMLGKCAEALALRKAFPQDLSGVYSADEMAAADPQAPTPPRQRAGMSGLRDAVGEPVDADVVDDNEPMVNMTTGEVVDTPPDSPPEAASPATGGDLIKPGSKLMKALHAALHEAGMGERDAGLAFIADTIDRDVASSKELTTAEAGTVLDRLTEIIREPFPEEPTS